METPGLLDIFPLWAILPLTIALSLVAVEAGYQTAKYRIVFSIVLVLIVDLDRPRQGMLQVTQQAMIDLRKSMQ